MTHQNLVNHAAALATHGAALATRIRELEEAVDEAGVILARAEMHISDDVAKLGITMALRRLERAMLPEASMRLKP